MFTRGGILMGIDSINVKENNLDVNNYKAMQKVNLEG